MQSIILNPPVSGVTSGLSRRRRDPARTAPNARNSIFRSNKIRRAPGTTFVELQWQPVQGPVCQLETGMGQEDWTPAPEGRVVEEGAVPSKAVETDAAGGLYRVRVIP